MKRIGIALFGTILFLGLSSAHAEQSWQRDGATAVGNVQVSSAADISALRGISHIKGDLIIMNFQGTDLRGLESLVLVDGMVTIFSNQRLATVQGLGGLEMIGGRLSIFSNPTLSSLSAFDKLRAVKAGVGVTDNPSLTSLFPKALRIGEPIHKLAGFLQISGNRTLGDSKARSYAQSCTLAGKVSIFDNTTTATRKR